MGRTLNTTLLAASLGATTLTGCSVGGLFRGERPGFEVSSARLVDRTEEGLKLEFTLAGFNTSDEPLPLRSIDYTLNVDGNTVFNGTRSAERTLPAGGSQDIILPAVVPLEALGTGTSPRYVLSGRIEYSKPGALADTLFDAKLIRPKIAFSDRGTLELNGIQPTGILTSEPPAAQMID